MQLPEVDGQRRERWTYFDRFGRKYAEEDEAGVLTGFGYDLIGRLTSVTNDLRLNYGTNAVIATRYSYVELGNQVLQKDALGRVIRRLKLTH